MRKPLLFLLLGTGLLLFGCIGGGEPTPSPSPAATVEAQANVVQIMDGSFSPAYLQIKTGGEVTWTNNGSQPRILYFIDMESPIINPGESWTRSFNASLEHTYLGEPWSPTFKGAIRVS